MDIASFSRQNIQKLKPYQSARQLGGNGDVWLNANEYPHSPDLHLTSHEFNRYPEPQPSALIESYAQYVGLNREEVLVSRGGDEGIELLIRAFCENDEAILYCPPTYGMYQVSAETCGIACHTVPLTSDFQLDLPAIEKQLDKVKIVYICSPNNPTGNLIRREDMIHLLEITRNKALCVFDEAYIEYCPKASFAKEIQHYPHLAIIRTLSKAFGLAGLRCGFTLANAAIIEVLKKVIAPYPIPVPVSNLAEQALSPQGIMQMQARVKETITQREQFIAQLKTLPQTRHIYPSDANYLLVHFDNGNTIFKALWEQGIILRNQHHHLPDCIRITIGSEQENQRVIDAIKSL